MLEDTVLKKTTSFKTWKKKKWRKDPLLCVYVLKKEEKEKTENVSCLKQLNSLLNPF